jgi:endonuclease-3 related protein
MEIHRLMFDRFGAQHWWPGESRFEIVLGAILTQNTNWTNVEKAIANVKVADALCPEKLYRMDTETLALLIKPAGYFNLKAGRLKNFLQWLFENYDGQIDALENLSIWDIREQLLSVKGIGPETADSIALYAYDKPVFVVDTYTCRIMVRHGLIEPEAGYEQVREFMEASLPGEIELFNEYHALLVQVGKGYCKPKPKCAGCPLECLPHEVDTC